MPCANASRPLTNEDRFWMLVRDPGCVPERKGPFLKVDTAARIREFMRARPFSFLSILTIDPSGQPSIEDGPQVLQTLDGRSVRFASKHIARLRSIYRAPARRAGSD